MANKTLKTRILLKTDTKANWEKAAGSFIPKAGEVCIYSDRIQTTNDEGETVYIPGIKVGDGVSYIDELEFMGDDYITNEDIDEILNLESVPTISSIPTVTLTFPQLDSSTLNMASITDYNSSLLFNTVDENGNIVLNNSFSIFNLCQGFSFSEDYSPGTIKVIPNTIIFTKSNHFSTFVSPSGNFSIISSNGLAATISDNVILEYDGPT